MPKLLRDITNARVAPIQRMGKSFINWALTELADEQKRIERRIDDLKAAFPDAPEDDPE